MLSLALDTSELQKLSGLPTERALRGTASFLTRLVNEPGFLNTGILPLLKEVQRTEDWYVAHRHDCEDGSYSLQTFVRPPGARTRIHDHSSRGFYCCAVGTLPEERYERLDEGSRSNRARLKKVWELTWSREDGASTILPYDEGIHRVGNPGASTAVSVHLYGALGWARSADETTTLPATTCATAGTSDDKTNSYSTSPKPLREALRRACPSRQMRIFA